MCAGNESLKSGVTSNRHLIYETILYEKNDFAKISKNLARYRFKNNFVGSNFCCIKIIMEEIRV